MFTNWLIKYAKKKPYFHLDGYMNRWWVIRPSRWHPFSARIHEILRSDDDRHLHDHPWSYITVILSGGYVEHTPRGSKWYGAGSILYRPYTSIHRLEVPSGTRTTTLFIMGPYRQGWGFHTEKGKVPWREYLGIVEADKADEELKKHFPAGNKHLIREEA